MVELSQTVRKSLEDQMLRFYSKNLNQEFNAVEAFKTYSDSDLIAFSLIIILSNLANTQGLPIES